MTVKANIYSQTLSNARKKGTITKGGKNKATPKAATGGSNLIQSAAAFIRAAGGIAAAKSTLDELEVIRQPNPHSRISFSSLPFLHISSFCPTRLAPSVDHLTFALVENSRLLQAGLRQIQSVQVE